MSSTSFSRICLITTFFSLGYNGTHCQYDIDECSINPCKNGGICTDQINSYKCSCPIGFAGPNCEKVVNDWLSRDCGCVHGDCLGGPNNFQCNCHPGYGGFLCDRPINECLANPCQNRGVCIDRADGYKCRCLPGTWGKNCEQNNNDCIDNPCINGECVDGINNYQVLKNPSFGNWFSKAKRIKKSSFYLSRRFVGHIIDK